MLVLQAQGPATLLSAVPLLRVGLSRRLHGQDAWQCDNGRYFGCPQTSTVEFPRTAKAVSTALIPYVFLPPLSFHSSR